MTESKTWQDHSGAVLDSVDGFDVIECERCGFKHIVPIPTPEELDEAYRGDYYSKEKPLYLERARVDLDWWETVYADRYDTLESLLGPDRRELVEIGSGPGFFLAHGKKRGWSTLGVEPSRQAAQHSRDMGLEIVEEFLDDKSVAGLGTFDALHASEVLEHVPDPHAMVRSINRLLRPGGVACVCVPNEYNPFQGVLREVRGFEPWWVAPPHHINYFDVASISALLKGAGFDVAIRESTFPIDSFLLMGENYIGDDALGRQCHLRRKTFEQALVAGGRNDLKRALFRAFADLGVGREIVVYGVKKKSNSE
jgi:SAM-dependent methyltransferase